MKTITPIQQTTDGPLCTHLKVWSVSDDLETNCDFNWILFDEIGQVVNNGMLHCGTEDYSTWNGNNEFPYNFVAEHLNIDLIS
jgi:hypothetical protein